MKLYYPASAKEGQCILRLRLRPQGMNLLRRDQSNSIACFTNENKAKEECYRLAQANGWQNIVLIQMSFDDSMFTNFPLIENEFVVLTTEHQDLVSQIAEFSLIEVALPNDDTLESKTPLLSPTSSWQG